MTVIEAVVSAPWPGWTILFAAVFAAVFHLLLAAAVARPRTAFMRGSRIAGGMRRPPIRRPWLVPSMESGAYKLREQLLRGCGFTMDAGTYLLFRRAALAAAVATAVPLYISDRLGHLLAPSVRVVALALLSAIVAVLLADKPVLESLMRRRRQLIVHDICAISRQLLYTCGSHANLHGKLVRCLPYAASIRDEWYLLTNEWYQSPETAIEKFKRRIGTEEGCVFAETLNAIRLSGHESYYELLRQRIDEYKDKLELLREGRKEMMSYLLFVMAGIPILYTFRLFVYPWVIEGRKLFDSLG